jgi:hypothetical protein
VKVLLSLILFSIPAAADVITLRPLATGLTSPLGITNAKDSRLFITQQTGQILISDGTQLLPTPFLDIHSIISCCVERGLLGLAFHPSYATNGFFFVYYTDVNGDINIARYKVSSDPNIADPSSATPILTISHRDFANHNGGQLQFGPDGYLYAGTGDGGNAGDTLGNGQNLQALLGKLLRIDIDHGTPYGIPPLNPFAGRNDARHEIWAYGMRNPWRFSFDRQTGDLIIGDVGQALWEEVDFQPAMDGGGENYGWNIMEGTHCYNATTCNQTGMTLPIIEYGHTNGACSITGGYRYRGMRSAHLQAMYIYADLCNGIITGASHMPDGSWTTQQLTQVAFNITSFGEDASGEIYVADYSGGRLLIVEDPLAPTITAVSPSSGLSTGGESVTISGTNLAGATSVTFGGAAATITANSATSITVTTPPATDGNVKIVVTNNAGSATSSFRYDLGAPLIVTATAASTQSVHVSWTSVPGATGYEISRSTDHVTFTIAGTTSLNEITDSTQVTENTAYLYRVRVFAGATFGPYSHVDLATTVIFDDDPLIAGFPIRAQHVSQLRTAVEAVRTLAGFMTPYDFADLTLSPGLTAVRAVHVTDLRAALDDARNQLMLPAVNYSEAITAGSTTIRVAHIVELRDGVK